MPQMLLFHVGRATLTQAFLECHPDNSLLGPLAALSKARTLLQIANFDIDKRSLQDAAANQSLQHDAKMKLAQNCRRGFYNTHSKKKFHAVKNQVAY